jgi:hypothetical protein
MRTSWYPSRHGRRRAAFPLCAVLLVMTAVSCGGEVNSPIQVKRLSPSVWAGSPAVLPPRLEHDDWQELGADGAVKTDRDGQAELQLQACNAPLFVAGDSLVQVAACRGALQGGEGADAEAPAPCARQGTVYFHGTCQESLSVDTYSGRIRAGQAAFSASYVALRRLTLVIVLDGDVTVQPVLDFQSGQLGPAIPVTAGHFLYTMPGLASDQIQGVPTREPRPLEELPAIVESLFIQRSIVAISKRAAADGILPQAWPIFADAGGKPTYLVLLGDGGPLEAAEVQRALLAAIHHDVLDQPSGRLEFLAEVGWAIVDAEAIAYDLGSARAQLAAAGYAEGFAVDLLFSTSWLQGGLWGVAEEIAADLRLLGLEVAQLAYGETQLYAGIQDRLEAGEPVLWLEVW